VINHFFTHPGTLARLRQGVLAEFLDDFAKSLNDQGYARESIRIQLRLIGAFSHWLKRKSMPFQEIDRGILDGFLRYHHRHHSTQNGDASRLQRFLTSALLQPNVGAKLSPNQAAENGPMIDEYSAYLAEERGLAESTIRYYLLFAARFLCENRIEHFRELARIRAVDVTGFVQRHARQHSPGSAKLMVTALRCFFRYQNQGTNLERPCGCCAGRCQLVTIVAAQISPTRGRAKSFAGLQSSNTGGEKRPRRPDTAGETRPAWR
jgi:hypothetical protein